jgi:subtilisin family serine protease
MAVLVAAGAVYGLAGHPGLHGERLFVVMEQQADLSGLADIPDREQRLEQTYRRLVDHADRTQAPLRAELDRYGLDYRPYYLVNAVLVDAGPLVREWLSRRSDVDRVLLDQRIRPLPVATPTTRGSAPAPDGQPLWNIDLIRADDAWRDARGGGITIGTSDSGVDGNHPALREGFRGGDDSWYDPWNDTTVPTDHGGHGTHTLGSALGRNGIGVAPEAQWIGCVNLDRNLGSPSLYLDCLQFMLAPFPHGGDPLRDGRPARAPHVLTNSWGCPAVEGCDGAAVRPAVAAFRAAGVFFVAAAGNSGPSCGSVSDEPSIHPESFTVGAVDRDKVVTGFSSRGPTGSGLTKPDVVAPGADIVSSLPGGTYGSYDGTSMATPHVAGVVALMWSANARLIGDIDTTARILRETAVPATPSFASADPSDLCGSRQNITGAGLVDAQAAVQAARRVS